MISLFRHGRHKFCLSGTTHRMVVIALMAVMTLPLWSQLPNFDLYFANNVTEVKNLDEIKSSDSGLNWTRVATASGDMSGNYAEVESLKQMFASTRKKYLADQQQFWTMRDHSLLCFRIEDSTNNSNGFEVQLDNGNGNVLVHATKNYFFANLPLQETPYEIKVYRTDQPEQCYRFRYFIEDWGNDSIYIFQLDQKRRATGKNYTLECVAGCMNEDGDIESDTTRLDLQASSFQTYYVPGGKDLLDVLLVDNGNKLRINKDKLHSGIDLNRNFDDMELSTEFDLDKHENREMMNFNWVGSGLYEQYDTLYLSLWNDRSRQITSATIHVESVDHDGNPTGNTAVRYIGYDTTMKAHKIVTMSQPAYIEIIANGYLPTVYKYQGAADAETGIVNEANCLADLTLQKGTVSSSTVTVGKKVLLNLHDKKNIIVRNGVDHCLCVIDPVDLSGVVPADTIIYLEDCGQTYPKLLNNSPVERFAKLEVAFCRPKTGDTFQSPQLFCTDIDNKTTREAADKDVTAILASDYKSFTYNHYFIDFSLLDAIPQKTVCSLQLKAGDMTYDDFPFLQNMFFDREEHKTSASNEVQENWTGESSVRGGAADAFAKDGWDLKLPFSFKTSFKPVNVNTSFEIDIRKRLSNLKINISYNRPDDDLKKWSDARKEKKALDNFNYAEDKNGNKYSFVNNEVKLDDWLYSDIDDIFNINAQRVGAGAFGGARLQFKLPFASKKFQVTEAAGQIGIGLGMYWKNLADNDKFKKVQYIMEKLENFVSFSGCAEFSIQADFGIKTFDKKITSTMNNTNMGYFLSISAKASAGATLQIHSPKEFIGLPIAKVFSFNAGLRFGGKLGLQWDTAGPFAKIDPCSGLRVAALVVGQAFCNIKTFIFSYSATAQFRLGGQKFIPDNDHNPLHPDFPYWLNDKKTMPMHQIYHKVQAPEPSDFGKALVENVAIDANPHFLDDGHVVYNDLKNPADYNDDQVTLMDIANGTTQSLSLQGTTAANHMRSKHGEHEIVVFEQMGNTIATDDVTEENALELSLETSSTIQASMRKGNGQWQQMSITQPTNDGEKDQKPVVTVQDDGHAACIYLHGHTSAIDENVPLDTLSNLQFSGQLMLKTYDGTRWSEPTPLYCTLDREHVIDQYDLLMRNDTVLVAAKLQTTSDSKKILRYASKTIASNNVTYTDDDLVPINFMMQRVGKHSLIAIVYQATDTIPDIYVRTMRMSGQFAPQLSANMNTGYKTPSRVKIICDRDAEDVNDFAVLWTEVNNIYRGDDGSKSYTDNIGAMLNASRIHMGNKLQLTDPITLGGERDSSLVLTDFDGFLDDAHISAVYTLADPLTGSGVIMANDKYFHNSCETDVAYDHSALHGSSVLPVSVYIKNTGTSPIIGAEVHLNGKTFNVEDCYVTPAADKTYTVLYPIDSDFDGYITSSVTVEYNNVFQLKAHPRHKAMSYLRQSSNSTTTRLAITDVECNIINQSIEDGVNTFAVELIDHRRLPDDFAVRVGLYPHLASDDFLNEKAEVVVKNSDFIEIGGRRKAYATVSIEGINEPLTAYLNCHVVKEDVEESADGTIVDPRIRNLHADRNAAVVNLFPASNPNSIHRPTIEGSTTGHRIHMSVNDKGVTLSNLKRGEEIRIFNTAGMLVARATAQGNSLVVPIGSHGIYVLSTPDETFKFRY